MVRVLNTNRIRSYATAFTKGEKGKSRCAWLGSGATALCCAAQEATAQGTKTSAEQCRPGKGSHLRHGHALRPPARRSSKHSAAVWVRPPLRSLAPKEGSNQSVSVWDRLNRPLMKACSGERSDKCLVCLHVRNKTNGSKHGQRKPLLRRSAAQRLWQFVVVVVQAAGNAPAVTTG